VNIIKLSFAVCIFLFSSIIFAGGSKSSVESSKYFVGVGAGDGGGAHGGSFNALRISYQTLLSHNTAYNFEYLSDVGLNIWKDESRLSAADKATATSDLDSSNISISYSRIIRKYITENIFFDAGIGLSIHNNESMNGSDLGSIYQFENRLGVGYERDTYRSVLNLFHYSNGGLEGKNDGVDILMLSISKYF
tara:strand:+ start:223 stop:798 length:576 start_codon:yes stop_codon:yes gene_type:complete